jgi:hypothetical protein
VRGAAGQGAQQLGGRAGEGEPAAAQEGLGRPGRLPGLGRQRVATRGGVYRECGWPGSVLPLSQCLFPVRLVDS